MRSCHQELPFFTFSPQEIYAARWDKEWPLSRRHRTRHEIAVGLKVTPRTRGQTATFGSYEWIYNPRALRPATLHQVTALAKDRQGPIRIYQWPERKVIFDSGRWLIPIPGVLECESEMK